MSSSSTRFIQITNNNSLITYQPESAFTNVPRTSDTFHTGSMGSPVSSSLKSAPSGTISFTFQGTSVTAVVSYISPTESQSNLLVNCHVGNTILGTFVPQSSQNNWAVCGSGDLPDGEHTLIIDIPNSAGPSIFFDYLLYAPSPSNQPNPSNVPIRIEETDPSVTYSGGFVIENDAPSTQFTNARNAFINVSFIGQQLTWYGAYSTSLPFIPSTAEYTIDGGSPTQFSLSGPTAANGPNVTALLDQILFETAVLPLGLHQLTATYLGDGQHTALSISYVVVQNVSSIAPPATVVPTSNAISPSPTTMSSQFTSPIAENQKSHSNQDLIIGIVVGVGAFLLLVAALFLFNRRHKLAVLLKRREGTSKKLSEDGEVVPVMENPQPSSVSAAENLPSLRREQTSRTVQSVTSDLSMYTPTLRIPPIPDQDQAREFTYARLTSSPADYAETSTLYSSDARSYTLAPTPFLVPRIPVPAFRKESYSPQPAARALSPAEYEYQGDNHLIPDDTPTISSAVAATNLSSRELDRTGGQPLLPHPSTEVAPTSDLPSDPITGEIHIDSGVRLGRQEALSYASSILSVDSKERLPPMYTAG